ncbi:hypothetical protein HPULCUR_004389 [Helicostylum pulchrum]|uniref:Uncharacterized protein n=1 Tax=Helicostylum pulchrum TaxID=562976 RepID=A0ABP9XXE0_9FUNG
MSSSTTTTSSSTEKSKIVWGFMFENTLFTEFERRNHPIIEAAYRQRKKKHSSHHITIVDSNLPKPGKAKVYFGVAQNHLRMPGTRYYVNRQIIRPAPSSPPFSVPMLMPSPTSTTSSSSSSFSSVDMSFASRQQQEVPRPQQQQRQQHQMSSYQQRQPQVHYVPSNYYQQQPSFCQQQQQQQQEQVLNSNTLAQVFSDDFSLLNIDQNIQDSFMNSSLSHAGDTPMAYYDTNTFVPDFNAWNITGDPTWFDNNLLLGRSSFPVPWPSQAEALDSNHIDLTNLYI